MKNITWQINKNNFIHPSLKKYPLHFMAQSKSDFPPRPQWGLLSNLKQQQYQHALRMQKQLQQHKKQVFRSQLDKQLKLKQNSNLEQKESDRDYYNFVVNKARQDQQREKQQKYMKFTMRRSLDFDNMRNAEEQRSMKYSRMTQQEKDQAKYVIGYRDEVTMKNQQQRKKRKNLQDLSQQIKYKQLSQKQQRMKQIQNFKKDLQYKTSLSGVQSPAKINKGQDPKVYEYYTKLYKKIQQEDKKLQYSLVQRPILVKSQTEELLRKKQIQIQRQKKIRFRDALDHQVDLHQTKIQFQRQPNPEQISYSYFGTMFGSKPYGRYDKNQYNKFLQQQMQEQKQNKKKLESMDQREYLYNLNQINKALHGTYHHSNYQDCSIANVGQKLNSDLKTLTQIKNPIRASSSMILENSSKGNFRENYFRKQVNLKQENSTKQVQPTIAINLNMSQNIRVKSLDKSSPKMMEEQKGRPLY